MISIFSIPKFNKKYKEYQKKFPHLKIDFKNLLLELKENPKKGILVRSNTYKIRLKNSDTNKGKSAGYRFIYYYLDENSKIIFLYMFYKGDISNLSDEYIDMLIKESKNYL